MANGIKVATVKATGKRYLVKHLLLPKTGPDKVVCWGELVAFRGLATRHEADKTFLRDAVEIVEVVKDAALCRALWNQGVASKVEAGHVVDVQTTRRGNLRATDHGTPEQMELNRKARAELDAELVEILSMIRK